MSDDGEAEADSPAGVPLADEADWIEYGAGNRGFRGRTTVRVEGTGRAVVRFRRGEDEREFERTLGGDRLAAFRETVVEHDPRTLEPAREHATADEVRIRIRFSFGGEEGTCEFWAGERRDDEAADALAGAFEDVAADVSDGEVTH